MEEIRPGKYIPFAEARASVAAEVERQEAARRFARAAEDFANLVYDQPDSLKPAAEAHGLAIQKSGWMSRESRENNEFANPKLKAAIFEDEVLKNSNNSKSVEIAPGVFVAARLLEHQPALLLPFNDVRRGIAAQLRAQKAGALAVEQGEAKLKELQEKDARATWGKNQSVSRINPGALPLPALQQIFRADIGKLPAHVGVALPGQGYALYRINKVSTPEAPPEIAKVLAMQIERSAERNDLIAYFSALRQRYKVKINRELLGAAEEAPVDN
jgi:peptidyl-prolyl cis-trans isomerase D